MNYEAEIKEFLDLADKLGESGRNLRNKIPVLRGTREEWNALECIIDAANRLRSAGAWLHQHEENFAKRSSDV